MPHFGEVVPTNACIPTLETIPGLVPRKSEAIQMRSAHRNTFRIWQTAGCGCTLNSLALGLTTVRGRGNRQLCVLCLRFVSVGYSCLVPPLSSGRMLVQKLYFKSTIKFTFTLIESKARHTKVLSLALGRHASTKTVGTRASNCRLERSI